MTGALDCFMSFTAMLLELSGKVKTFRCATTEFDQVDALLRNYGIKPQYVVMLQGECLYCVRIGQVNFARHLLGLEQAPAIKRQRQAKRPVAKLGRTYSR